MSNIEVRPVATNAERRSFVDLPYRLYSDSTYWVPPLRRDTIHTLSPRKNPFFDHGEIQLFLARDLSGRIVGRIAAIVNGMHLKKHAEGAGFFGFFECEEDSEIARRLLDAVKAWLTERNLRSVRGPVNPSMNDMAGLLVNGFDREPSILMPYNPPYYQEYLEAFGFERVMTMWAYYMHKKYVQIDRLRRGSELLRRRYPQLHVRRLDMKRFNEEAAVILDIYNDAWSENWGHVPMTEREFAHLAKDMKQIVDPNLVYFVEDAGEPVAFSISLPNLNLALKHIKNGRLFPTGLPRLLGYARFGGIYECRTLLMGVRRRYQGRGLDAMLNLETIEKGPRSGYDAAELSWILDVNTPLLNALKAYGAVADKEYAMFEAPT